MESLRVRHALMHYALLLSVRIVGDGHAGGHDRLIMEALSANLACKLIRTPHARDVGGIAP